MLKQALAYDNNTDNNASLESTEVQGDRLYIPCNAGVLIVTYTDKMGH
ncbi:MAG: hypothetical protein IMF14_07915 [Proteobacteria bacterium]|nr:hypothetical protein [Pseudomonadota bacterium]